MIKKKGLTTILCGACLLLSCAPVSSNERVNLPSNAEQDGYPTIQKAIEGSLLEGVSLNFEEFTVTIDGKKKKDDPIDDNVLDFSSFKLDFSLPRLSLDAIKLSLSGSIDYNGVIKDIDFKILDGVAYIKAGSLKYQVSLSRRSVGAAPTYDDLTGGEITYEYGDLDEIIEVLYNAIVDGTGSSTSSSSTEQSSIDWSIFLESLEQIEQNSGTFVWNMKLKEEGDTYPIGLFSTIYQGEYTLSGIEFPYGASSYSISDNVRIKAKANLTTGVEPSSFTAPTGYQNLYDSYDLIEDVANLVKENAFGITADNLTIYHNEAGVAATETTFGKDPVDEGLVINGDINIGLEDKALKNLSVEANLEYLKATKNGSDISYAGLTPAQSMTLGVYIDAENASAGDKDIYLNINELAKLKTNKLTFDEIVSEIKGILNKNGEEEDASLSGILSSIGTLQTAIDDFKQGRIKEIIDEGHYEGVLEAIDSIEEENNRIVITFNLASIDLTGSFEVSLSSLPGHSLLSIDFTNAKFSYFTLNGSVKLNEWLSTLAVPANDSSYTEMNHLPSLVDELGIVSSSKQAKINISGYVLKEGKISNTGYRTHQESDDPNVIVGTEQGFNIDGGFAIDLNREGGYGNLTFIDIKQEHVNDHNVDVAVTGPRIDGANSQDDNKVYFAYDSKNHSTQSNETISRTSPSDGAEKGFFSITSVRELIDLVKGKVLDSEDPRFERITNLISGATTTSLISMIKNGEYFNALTSELIKSFEITSNHAKIVLPKTLLGLASDMTINCDFQSKTFTDSTSSGGTQTVSNALTSLSVALKMGDEDISAVYVKVEIEDLDFADDIDFAGHYWSDTSSFTDYSTLSKLFDYALGTLTLTNVFGNSESTYHISGTLKGKLFSINAITIPVDLFVRVKGASVELYGRVEIDYFLGVVNNDTKTEFYYRTTAEDTEGTIFFRRMKVESTLGLFKKYVMDYRKVRGKDFMNDLLMWIFSYVLNLSSLVTSNFEGGEASTRAIHGEDAITGYSYAETAGAPSFTIGLNLAELARTGISMSMNDLTITGKNVLDDEDETKKTLGALNGTLKILSIISLVVDLSMESVSDGHYHDCWNTSDAWSEAEYWNTSTTSLGTSYSKQIFSTYFYNDDTKTYSSEYESASWYTDA